MLRAVIPVGGHDAYQQQRQKRFTYSPESLINYTAYINRISDITNYHCDYKPWKYQLEPNSSCNLSCQMCAVSTWDSQQRAADLSLTSFRQIIDENPALLELNLCPLGEPLLRGDDFFAMCTYARSKEIWTRTVTNATLLHANDNYKKLAFSNFNEVVISIDSFNKSTYESIRRGSKLSNVLRNIELLHGFYRNSDIPINTKLNAVLITENKDSVDNIIQRAVDIGFSNISITIDAFNWGLDALDGLNVYSSNDDLYFNHLADLWSTRGIDVGFVTTTNKFHGSTSSLEDRCSWPFSAMYIGSDLRYPPCCHVGDPDVFEVNVPSSISTSPLAVWFSDQYSLFRQQHISQLDLPKVCKPCYVNNS